MEKQTARANKQWYKTNVGIVLCLLCFFPVGFFLMWRYAQWKRTTKWGVIILFLFFFIVNVESVDSHKSQVHQASFMRGRITPTAQPARVGETADPTPSLSERMNIVVTSVFVKKVAPSTYRYFFTVTNQDTADFTGTIFIQLFKGFDPHNLPLSGATQSYADDPIQPGARSVTYIDDSHAPSQSAGGDGATAFTFTASVHGTDVATDKESIAGQDEDDVQH